MKKIIYIIVGIIIFLTSIQSVGAISWSQNSGLDNCGGGGVSNTSGQKQIPSSNSMNASASGNRSCETHGYYAGILRPGGWRTKGTSYTCPDDEYASYRVCNNGSTNVSCTTNGSGWTRYRVFCKFRDDTAPTAADISNSVPADGTNFLATSSQNISISVGRNGGAPIVQVRGYFENDTTTNSYISSAYNSNSDTLSNNYDIRNVDNNRGSGGRRQYSLKVTRVCDEAGNCTTTGNNNGSSNGIKNYTYHVRAAQIHSSRSGITGIGQLTSGDRARGDLDNVRVTLKDVYGNELVRVPSVGRNVDVNVNYNNSLYLDEYRRTGPSAVTINGTSLNIGTNQNTPNSGIYRNDSDGIYDLDFRTFVATSPSNAYIESSGQFRINNITGEASDLSPYTFVTNQNFHYRPLYTTNFDGDLENYGFIEGAVQNSTIDIVKDGGGSNGSSRRVYLEFGAEEQNNLLLVATPGGNVVENQSLGTTFQGNSSFTGNNKTLSTLLTQSSTVRRLQDSFLASVVSYNLNTRTVVYPSDIINKARYNDVTYDGGAAQTGIKIIGNTASENTGEIVEDQFTNDVRILGKFTKSTFRKDIQQKAYQVIRYVASTNNGLRRVTELGGNTWNNGSSDGGEELLNETVLYFKNPSTPVEIRSDTIEGVKTLVIENGDVYINGDIVRDSIDDILGIIVLDGNIYIDPDVRDIEAILYTDKSVISYDGSTELDGSTPASDLAHQLYINGSIFSENTIGGSRKASLECPFYVDSTDCDNVATETDFAQKYDLNYLRRYFIYDSNDNGVIEPTVDNPAHSGNRSAGGGIGSGYETYPIIIEYNPQIQQTPPPFFD